jgi:hypothetical protein
MRRLVLLCTVLIGLGSGIACGRPVQKPKVNNVVAVAVNSSCDSNRFPIGKGDSPSCCQQGSDIFHVLEGTREVIHRQVGPACTNKDPRVTCIGKACDFGPCGTTIVPIVPSRRSTKDGIIFVPMSNPHECGYQATETPTSGFESEVISSPEAYSQQPQYSGVIATCLYKRCPAHAGPPVSDFEITIRTLGATGRVKSNPAGITLSGSGKASGAFSDAVTLTAQPTGRHARAVFSGDCIETGEYGKSAECRVKLAPDPKVTVTYECEKDFRCSTQ